MKLKEAKKVLYYLLIVLVVASCQKDDISTGDGTPDVPDPGTGTTTVLTPAAAHLKMTHGINLGRCLDLDNNGTTDRIQEFYFDDIKTAGFDFVRIPIKWEFHVSSTSPYTVDAAWMTRVEQVVDWALKRNLIVIINSHHDKWFYENYGIGTNNDRFDAIWTQVADKFKDKSENLFFEIINEPKGLTTTNSNALNTRILSIIRAKNPKRIVVYSGNNYTGLEDMEAATIPTDKYVIATYHDYSPFTFTLTGVGTWGSATDIEYMKNRFKNAGDWSKAKNMPVFLGEFGTIGSIDPEIRKKWFRTYVEEAITNNISFSVWNDFGDFSVYFPNNSASTKWSYVKDIVMYANPKSATSLASSSQADGIHLVWINRGASLINWNKIQRQTGSGEYENIGQVSATATSYIDANVIAGTTYNYRITSELTTGSKEIRSEIMTKTF
jgi:aryl-phospho-beta-D-glucosidase BglC (GH1 family)